jgi:hypothetical protein
MPGNVVLSQGYTSGAYKKKNDNVLHGSIGGLF